MGRFARELPQRLKQDFAGTMTLLRNPDFQKLLLKYPRAERGFIETIEDKDVVTSQKLERYGRFDSAEDYLDALAAFVNANAEKVAALAILLTRPQEWRPAVLEELKRTMAQRGFDAERLQRAHQATGFKALADVISIVKHAAAQQAPLLTSEERVNRALDRFLAAHKLTAEQMQWLSLVREHLVKNLSMDEEDFDLTPLLQMRGGKARASRPGSFQVCSRRALRPQLRAASRCVLFQGHPSGGCRDDRPGARRRAREAEPASLAPTGKWPKGIKVARSKPSRTPSTPTPAKPTSKMRLRLRAAS